ncbi:MAG: K(+)-transporting ATPase subunit C [Acidimicrobiales bacterium]
MRRQLLPALRLLLVCTVVLGLAYPVVVLGLAQVGFKAKADGSLVTVKGAVVGSSLIGQQFSDPKYFQPRASAAGPLASGTPSTPDAPVDPSSLAQANSGGSNLGPTNDTLLSTVEERAAAYRQANGLAADAQVPVDAVTASGSGVDPHISIANARLQAPRVAQQRNLSVDQVNQLVDANTEGRTLGVLGEPGVNVLTLNLALDGAGSS